MSADLDSGARTADEDDVGVSAPTFDHHGGKLGRTGPYDRYGLTTRAVGAAMLECSSLSPRECGILKLIGQGYSNKRVARALGITAETVKWYVKRVFVKLDVNTRAHAVARAQSLGLFGLELVRPQGATPTPESDESVGVSKARHSISEY